MKKVVFYLVLNTINHILKGTKFFNTKMKLLNFIGLNIGSGTKIVGPIKVGYINKVKIGNDCWIGKNFSIDGNGSVTIGDRCDIAPNVLISTGGHQIGDIYRRAGKGLKFKTVIKNGTWIGTNVIIINGANIDDSVVVAAGSLVIGDVEKNNLVAGVPAEVKKILV
ncbi:acyltransferase [Peribacillus sp. NPDC097206]|uniref:acyltransferase n=1 Tax=unclassified Peribacillus TaxID=2675266 RepID=UPI003805C923